MPADAGEGLLVHPRTWAIDERATNRIGHDFDVVAIHGLGGGRETTWTAADERKPCMWLTDLLPGRLKNPTIMTYEYCFQNDAGEVNFDIESKASNLLGNLISERERHSGRTRSLIFIGHDVGGVVLKCALLAAFRTEKYAEIAAKTSLLVFFGTPHRATDGTSWERVSGNLISASGYGKGCDFQKMVKQLSHKMKRVCEDFLLVSKVYKTVSFYEEGNRSLPDQVVGQDTARLPVGRKERAVPIRRGHFELGQILNDKEESFKTIVEALSGRTNLSRGYLDCLRVLHSFQTHTFKPVFSEADLATLRTLKDYPAYQQWLRSSQEPDRTLCIHGLKGSGRSSLASWAALRASQSLEESVESIESTLIGYHFDSKDDRSRSTFQMYASLSYQLLCLRPQLFDHVQYVYEELSLGDDINGPCLKLDWLWSIFQGLVSCPNHGEIICVINNIDECKKSGRRFLEDLFILPKRRGSIFRLVFTSTSGCDLNLKVPAANRINVENEAKRGKEIENIVKQDITNLIKRRPLYRDFESDITGIVCRPSAALHETRLVITLLDVLNVQSTRSAVEKSLRSIPRTDFDVHKLLLDQIHTPHLQNEESGQDNSKTVSHWIVRAIYWIANAFRPLTLGEISEAVAFEDDIDQNTESKVKDRIMLDVETDLKRKLGRLVMFQNDGISFAHKSWHDYLKDQLTPQSDRQHIPGISPHFFMASTCLQYIELTLSSTSESPQKAAESFSKVNQGLLRYAVQYWPYHYQKATLDDKSRQKFLRFFNNDSMMKFWSELNWHYQNPVMRREANPLSTAAEFGCSDLVDALIESLSSNVAERWSALEVAIEAGQKGLVKKLLDSGAQNTRAVHIAAAHGRDKILPMLIEKNFPLFEPDKNGLTPLHVAAQCGSLSVVKTLLAEGGHSALEARNKNGQTPLHWACKLGHANVVQYLLEANADQDAVSSYGSSALHLACKWQHPYVVETLLEKSQSGYLAIDIWERLPLHHAAVTGRVDIVRMLLHSSTDRSIKDVQLERQDEDSMTPLHIAAELGHTEVAAELVKQTDAKEPGATAIMDSKQRVPLHFAAMNGHLEIVKCLLEKSGEQAMALTESLSNPIHLAVQQRHLDVVTRVCEEHKKRGYSLDVFDSRAMTPLHLACQKGDLAIVEVLLEYGAQAEITGTYNNISLYSPLHIACENGFSDIGRALIRFGADPDAVTSEKSTPLHLASRSGDLELAKRLATMSHMNPRDAEGRLPIHLAALGGHQKLFMMLYHKGSELDDNHRNGRTLLHYACEGGNVELVKIILKNWYGDDVDVPDNAGRTPLHMAARAGQLDVVDELISNRADPMSVDEDNSTPLMLATDERVIEKLLLLTSISPDGEAEATKISDLVLQAADKGYTRLMTKLLDMEHGDPNSIDEFEESALAIAAKRGHTDLVRLLLSKGADAEKKNREGRTPVSFAARNAHCDVIRQLLEKRKDTVNTVDSEGRSPISYAAAHGHTEAVKILREFQADINTVDEEGRSPLLAAVLNNHIDTVKLLLSYKADPNAKDKHERTSLHIAAHYGYSNIAEAFQDYGDRLTSINDADIKGATPMYIAAYNGHTACIGVFLNMGLDKEKPGARDWRPLHAAYDSLPIVRLLLKANAEKDAVNNHGDTTLSLAIRGGYWDVAEELIQKGASLFVPNESGLTPLHQAASSTSIRILDLMLRLLGTGDINIKDKEGRTPFMEAAREGRVENVKEFLKRDDVDIFAMANDGSTSLWKAIERGHKDVVNVLLDRIEEKGMLNTADVSGRSLDDLILHIATYGNSEILDRVWNRLKNPGSDERLLELALKDHLPWLVDYLVSKDVYTDNRDKHGWNLKCISFANAPKDGSSMMTAEDLPQCNFLEPDCWDGMSRMKGMDFVDEQDASSEVNPGSSENSSDILTSLERVPTDLNDEVVEGQNNDNAGPRLHVRAREASILSFWRRRRPRDVIMGIRANHPVPPNKLFYFEVKVLDPTAVIAIGFCTSFSPMRRLTGWQPDSWGYHSDNGGLYHASGHYLSIGNGKYGAGDIVGCGIDIRDGTAFFTKNGKRLVNGFTEGVTGRVYPTVGFKGPGEAVANFTGETEPFKYDLKHEQSHFVKSSP